MLFHHSTLDHLRALHDWARRRSAQVTLDVGSFALRVQANGRAVDFTPQFVYRRDGQSFYRPDLTAAVYGVIGWLPYFNKRWPAALDKVNFKLALLQADLPTPELWIHPDDRPANVLIKPRFGSFGVGIRGPFRQIGDDTRHRLAEGEFYERLVAGSMLKVWYWDETPVCIERREPLVMRGDGAGTVLERSIATFNLDDPTRKAFFERRKPALDDVLAFQGVRWDSVLPNDAPLCVDFTYGSPLHTTRDMANHNLLEQERATGIGAQVAAAARVFAGLIPAPLRPHVLYSTDAILDRDGKLWWLEMNCNPMLPPDAYDLILDDLFFADLPARGA